MKRTRIYIDGYNLYYGLLKGSVHKWLDLVKFSQELLAPDHEIVEVNYFTSIITPHPYERESIERQNVYLQALGTNPLVRVEKGRYYKRIAHLPPVSKGCQSCDELRNGYVRVYKFEEKQSDVNLAVRMVRDAALGLADTFVLITGDSDQIGTIHAIRKDFGKQVLVFNPHESPCLELKMAATHYRTIPRDLPARCQLPSEIRRPEAWK